MKKIDLPLSEVDARTLEAGDVCLLSGTLLTARDAAHRRFIAALDNHEPLPVNLDGETLFFVGPTPARPGSPCGSAGPTTSYRMDAFSPRLIRECCLRGMIGKGPRSAEVVAAMKAFNAVYFAATGGAGALLGKCIVRSEIVAYDDLGPEAVRRFTVKDFPVIVGIDASGRSLYDRAENASSS